MEFDPGRRRLLKAVFPPFGIAVDIAEKGSVNPFQWSSATKFGIVGWTGILGIAACQPSLSMPEVQKIRTFKERILNATWEDVDDPEKLPELVNLIAENYIYLTNSDRVTRKLLVNNTKFYHSNRDFENAIRSSDPQAQIRPSIWGYANYDIRTVYINLLELKAQNMTGEINVAGLALLDALWHEWGHLDVSTRENGSLLNNPDEYFRSPISQQNEKLKYYRGGAVYSDTYYGFTWFEEVLNETVTVRRMTEQVGFHPVISAGDYYPNGVDFFPLLTLAAGISSEELYIFHATSDFEGLAVRIGQILPGKKPPMAKGIDLFIAIHRADRNGIRETGAFQVIENRLGLTTR